MAKLGDICNILNGYAFKSEKYVDSGIRVIRITNVQKGYIEDIDPKFYSIEYSDELSKYILENGDLLMSLTGNVGRVGILSDKFLPAALNQRVACLRLKGNEIFKPFLFHFLNSDYFEQMCINSSNGIAQKNLSTEWLKEVYIPEYSKGQQKQIAANLDKVTHTIDLCNNILKKLDLLVKARFVEMFCGTNDWKYVHIQDICTDMRTGPFGSALHHDEFVDSGIFVLGIDNAVENEFSYNRMRFITEEKYQQLKRYTVKPHDVIITIMGTVGRSAVIPLDIPLAINTKHLACLTLNKDLADSSFVAKAIQIHPELLSQLSLNSKGAIMDGLNLTIIKGLKLRLPPLDLQQQFAAFVEQTDKSKSAVKQVLEKAETLKNALMQEYFG